MKLSLVSCVLIAAGLVFAADDLPKAETILDKAVEATGGKAAYQKIHSEISHGSMSISGMTGEATTYKAAPDKVMTEIVFQGLGTVQEGSDGKVAWSNSAMQGPHIKEGEEKEVALLMAKFDGEANWHSIFTKAETAGVESVDGKDCYKVVLTPKAGKPMTRFYEKESGLLRRSVMTMNSPMGEITVESTFDDYQKTGDILSPHKMTNKAMGQQFAITIDKVEYNTEIPASKFDLPDAVKALMK
jgi:outer membrane lipoprotein-sorting protein